MRVVCGGNGRHAGDLRPARRHGDLPGHPLRYPGPSGSALAAVLHGRHGAVDDDHVRRDWSCEARGAAEREPDGHPLRRPGERQGAEAHHRHAFHGHGADHDAGEERVGAACEGDRPAEQQQPLHLRRGGEPSHHHGRVEQRHHPHLRHSGPEDRHERSGHGAVDVQLQRPGGA